MEERRDSAASDDGGMRQPPPPGDRECAICLETVRNPAYVDGCRHWFCFRCIKRCANRRNFSCPVCRHPAERVMHWQEEDNAYEEYVVGLTPRQRRMMEMEMARRRPPRHNYNLRSRAAREQQPQPQERRRDRSRSPLRGYNLRSRFVEFRDKEAP